MALFSKKSDPITDRGRALSEEIAALEEQIRELDAQLASAPAPRLRSTAMPHGVATVVHAGHAGGAPAASDPIFEDVGQGQERLKTKSEAEATPEHFNELGIRKYDLTAFFKRAKNHVRGPAPTNPKLVSYLAAGSIQGLRPMRYEKRVARNRFLVLAVVLLGLLIGILTIVHRQH